MSQRQDIVRDCYVKAVCPVSGTCTLVPLVLRERTNWQAGTNDGWRTSKESRMNLRVVGWAKQCRNVGTAFRGAGVAAKLERLEDRVETPDLLDVDLITCDVDPVIILSA
jgi:hypothetical protein